MTVHGTRLAGRNFRESDWLKPNEKKQRQRCGAILHVCVLKSARHVLRDQDRYARVNLGAPPFCTAKSESKHKIKFDIPAIVEKRKSKIQNMCIRHDGQREQDLHNRHQGYMNPGDCASTLEVLFGKWFLLRKKTFCRENGFSPPETKHAIVVEDILI